jgi:hypothetical protein
MGRSSGALSSEARMRRTCLLAAVTICWIFSPIAEQVDFEIGVLGAVLDLQRLREISTVLIRHGLGDLVRRTGLATMLERAGQILLWAEGGKTAETRTYVVLL